MAFSDAPICDTCGAVRQLCNHWWTSEPESNGGLLFRAYAETEQLGYIKDPRVKVHCGQGCAHKRLDEYLSSKNTTAPTEVKADCVNVESAVEPQDQCTKEKPLRKEGPFSL